MGGHIWSRLDKDIQQRLVGKLKMKDLGYFVCSAWKQAIMQLLRSEKSTTEKNCFKLIKLLHFFHMFPTKPQLSAALITTHSYPGSLSASGMTLVQAGHVPDWY